MFQSGDLLILFNIGPHDVDPFSKTKYFRPIGEWMDRIDPDVHKQIKNWILKFENAFGPIDIGDPNTLCYPA